MISVFQRGGGYLMSSHKRPVGWCAAICAWLLGLAMAFYVGLAGAAESPTEPQLRIEAGMHTASIRRIATDAQGRWAVTASDDKTARVWDVANGRLLQVLRPPRGAGDEGKLNAVAMSPDGAVVAAAGWTELGSDVGHTVYLFSRSTGQLIRRLRGQPNVIFHLAFSQDGRWLAATLAGSNGVRVWRLTDEGSAPLVDADYGDASDGAHFGPPGPEGTLLATSSYDGKLRLYRLPTVAQPGAALKPLQVQAARGGKQPYGVAFSPDGRLLAVGYADSTRVDVLDGATLAWRYSPDTTGVGNGNLATVAFSADGRTLAAAGLWHVYDRFTVAHWPSAGQGPRQYAPTAGNTILSLVPLPPGAASGSSAAGGWLVGASDPAWGQLQADGRWVPRGTPPTADLRGSRGDTAFLLGDSGRVLQFGYEQLGNLPHHFDLRQRLLLAGALPGGQPPHSSDLKVESWQDSTRPTLSGQPLKLEDNEIARSLALLPDASGFALGSEWNLRLFNADGTNRWPPRAVPGTVWGVNIPQTGPLAGKIIVAAYGDGTIRWHRVSDGAELLAFFPHADRQRWVLWTPSGYYDASPGAEDLIGWHVNRGADAAADFFPASRFRSRFYRPDVIDRVLDTLDEAEGLKQADVAANRRPEAPLSVAQVLPPVVEVLSGAELSTSSPQMTLRVRGRTAADAPVTAWRVRVNGQAVADARGLGRQDVPPAGGEHSITVAVPPQDSEVQVFAESRHGVSTAAVVRVKWAGAPPAMAAVPAATGTAPAAGFQIQPRLYVLAVGVGRYQHGSIPKLTFPAKDARDFVAALRRQQGRLYREVAVKLLTESEATADAVVDGLDWLQKQVTQHDVGVVFIAGHGVNDSQQGYSFLPVDADPARLRRSGVSMDEFKKTLSQLPGKALFFFDTCHSGSVLGGPRARADSNDVTRVINELSSAENGVIVFSSSTGRQLSYEDTAWNNGAFTKAVVEGLDGAANYQGSGRITHKMLDLYISERVKALTGGKQSPVTQAPGGVPDFPVALVK